MRKKRKKKRRIRKSLIVLLIVLLALFVKDPFIYHGQRLFQKVINSSESLKFEKEFSAKSYAVMDLTNHKILFSKNSYESYVPASLTKLFVVDYAQQFFQLDDYIHANRETLKMVKKGSSTAHLKSTDYRFKSLAAAMLIPSGNDAAYVLADAIGAKINPKAVDIQQRMEAFKKGFQEYLNKHQFLGTSIADSSGYDFKAKTNIQDLIKVSERLLQKDWIRDIISSQSYTITYIYPKKQTQTWYNTNDFLNPNSEFYDKRVKGMKTGSLGNHFNLITLLEKNKKEYLILVLDSHSETARYSDTKQLIDQISNQK